VKSTSINTWRTVTTVIVVLLGGLLSSCGAELIPPVTAAAPAEIGQTAAPSPRKSTTITTKPVFDSFGIIVHKNAVPDSFIVQFRDDMVVAKGQNLILNMGLAKSIAAKVVEENQLKTVKMRHVFNAAIRGFSGKMTYDEAAILVKDPRVLLVEQDAYVHVNTVYTSPGWALDRIDQASPNLNNSFTTNLTGAGVHLYNLDQGALPTHTDFAGRIQCGAVNSPDIQGGMSGGCVEGAKTFSTNISIGNKATYTPSPAIITGNKVLVKIYGGTGDADLYVKKGAVPTTSSYDCRPYDSGNTESCDMSSFGAGTYYIMVYGYRAVGGLTLERFDTCASTNQGAYGDACASGKSGEHGTGTLSLSGGATAGVAKSATLHTVRTMPNSGDGLLSDQVAGYNWVAANKGSNISVINFSIGEDGIYAIEDNAIAACVDSGIFVAVAAGNAMEDAAKTSPGSSSAAFVVGATSQGDSVAGYSNWGGAVDLWAPGTNVRLATITSNTAFTTNDGTSFASPLTAGVAALYRGQNPSATVPQVKTAILSAAASGKLTGYLGPAGNMAPNLFLQSFGTNCGDTVCNGIETTVTCAADCPSDGGGSCPGVNCTTWPQSNLSTTRDVMKQIGTISCNNPTITSSGGLPDADLYVKIGGWPSYSSKTCVSESSSNNETCNMANGNVKYYISMYGYNSAPSGVTISVVCH
jgi:Subtilase family/Bacterial pre-peptidase C-terminal domain/Peptidase inhibitor I9